MKIYPGLRFVQVAVRAFQGMPGGNELLDYLKSLDSAALLQLTSCAGDDIIEAMNAFIHRLLGCALCSILEARSRMLL